MAALYLLGSTPEQTLVAATRKTLYQLIAPANQRLRITGWGVSLKGTSTTGTPATCELAFQSTAIGGTPTAANPKRTDSDQAAAVQSTGAYYGGSPTEPTTGDQLDQRYQHPQGGFYAPAPERDAWILGAGDRVGILVTAPEGTSAIPVIHAEE